MDNGFSTSDAVLTSAMSGGFGGRSGGSWGNNGCGSPFADPGSNAARILANRDLSEAHDQCTKEVLGAGMSSISDQFEEGRRAAQNTTVVDAIVNSEFRTSDRISGVKDGQFAGELRTNDRQRDTDRTLQDMRLENCKCCEEAKLLAVQNACATNLLIVEKHAASDALALAIEGRGTERDNSILRAEVIALKTQIACGCNCPS